MLGIADVDAEFMPLQQAQAAKGDAALPKGVQRSGRTLVFERPGQAPLRLTDFVYKGRDDGGDSQRFIYLKTLEKFHLLSVAFSHDRPCFLLVERQTLALFFVDYAPLPS